MQNKLKNELEMAQNAKKSRLDDDQKLKIVAGVIGAATLGSVVAVTTPAVITYAKESIRMDDQQFLQFENSLLSEGFVGPITDEESAKEALTNKAFTDYEIEYIAKMLSQNTDISQAVLRRELTKAQNGPYLNASGDINTNKLLYENSLLLKRVVAGQKYFDLLVDTFGGFGPENYSNVDEFLNYFFETHKAFSLKELNGENARETLRYVSSAYQEALNQLGPSLVALSEITQKAL